MDDLPPALRPGELESTWYARWPGASSLTTTRSQEYGALGTALDLGVLRPSEAFDLLSSRRKPAEGPEENGARRIVELLGYHPLAVEVAGKYLAEGFDTFESYVDALVKPGEDAVEFGASLQESLPTRHERSISATLLRSIRQLDAERLDFLRLASVLAVAPIQVSFLSEVFGLLGPEPKLRAVKAVNDVEALSLCDRSGDEARTVHTLVSRTVRFQVPTEDGTAKLRFAGVKALTERLERVGHIGEHFKITMDMPHARHLVNSDLQTEQDATLALWVARRDSERGDYASARTLQEQALAAFRRLLGEEHPDTLTSMNNLAQTLYAQGDLAGARKLQKQVLAASCRVLGEEHPNTLTSMNNLAQTLYAQRDLAGARKLEEQALTVSRRALGEEHPNTLIAMNNLAQTLYAQGDLAGARKLEEQVLAARRRVLGEEHPDTLMSKDNLAWMKANREPPDRQTITLGQRLRRFFTRNT